MIIYNGGGITVSVIGKDDIYRERLMLPDKNGNALSSAGRIAAAELFSEYFFHKKSYYPNAELINNLKIGYGEYGKPYLTDYADFHFNISHSGDFAAAVYCTHTDSGIDIEKIRDYNENVVRKCFSSEQKAEFYRADEKRKKELYSYYWTVKEAGIKALGKSVFSAENIQNKVKTDITLFYPSGYIITAAEKV